MVITFMLFPNLSLIAKTTIGPVWSSIMIILCFNLGDFIGKLIGDRREIFNNKTVAVIFYGRLFFFYTIPLLTKKIIEADFLFNNTLLVLFNQFLFGFTNGLISSKFKWYFRCCLHIGILNRTCLEKKLCGSSEWYYSSSWHYDWIFASYPFFWSCWS